ncbi:FAD-dependent monooxygenase [Thermomonospora umbrina]|uniref:Monooxygenase n=1 Tax=Thermomonospora umbrina TaxID=111806 RepID=A0A3D9SU84_9ACTN|nr:FAD-dependent monooxygenase [Thermomonospora umbrina]REE99529.1 monooxygenase [Thermomonospora umbrina]
MIDVAVVGGGPVGMLVAAEVALQGVRPVVLERLAEPGGESKAGTLHARTAQSLDRRGLLEAVGRPVYGGVGFHFSGMFGLDLGRVVEDGPTLVGSPQAWAEHVFAERALESGAEIRRGQEVTGLVQHDDRVTLTVNGREVDARYVVGADGARSVVRKAAGIAFTGTEARVAALMGAVRLPDDLPGGWHRTPRGWLLVWPARSGRGRITTYDYRGPHADRQAPVTLDELRAAAEYIAGRPIPMSDPQFLSRYGDAALQAETYRRGRVLLAGDAAHVHFPWGGQGLNTGLEDAFNLGWKLAAEVRGTAPRGLLDTYHSERHPVAARVLWNVRAQNALAHPDPAVDPLRELFAELMRFDQVNEHLSGMVSGVRTVYDVGVPGAGHMAPDMVLHVDGRTVRLVELLRAARPLLLDLADRDDLVEVVEGGPVSVVRAKAERREPTDALLVRPDGYVAWAGGDVASLRRAVARWF